MALKGLAGIGREIPGPLPGSRARFVAYAYYLPPPFRAPSSPSEGDFKSRRGELWNICSLPAFARRIRQKQAAEPEIRPSETDPLHLI